MAEVVLRKHHRKYNRWMPERKRWFSMVQWGAVVQALLRMLPGYLLSFAEMLGVPSGLWAAYATALAAAGKPPHYALCGSAAGLFIRVLSGMSPHWEMLLTACILMIIAVTLQRAGTVRLMLMTGAALVPVLIVGALKPTAAEMIRCWACVAIAMLSAPIFARACIQMEAKRPFHALEDKTAVGYFIAMLICGSARMLLFQVNVGCTLASVAVLMAAMTMGCGAGTLVGMLAGCVLVLQGLPMQLPIALSMGGFMAGTAHTMGKRRWTCVAFAAASHMFLNLSGASALGCGAGLLAAAVAVLLMPAHVEYAGQRFARRFLSALPVPGDAYAASALGAWEKTVEAMARAVPEPYDPSGNRSAQWWESRLCEGCPEQAQCGCMQTEAAVAKAELVWACRSAQEEVWQNALEHLRGLGCQRLYLLFAGMNMLRAEDEESRKVRRQADAQREMLITHLTAMSGAARRFAMLSGGESWWDDMAGRRLRRVMAEHAVPVTLSYVRRVEGHAQVAFELEHITGAWKQAQELCDLTAQVMEAAMQVVQVDGDRVTLSECPPYALEVGTVLQPVTGKKESGDAVWYGQIQDGRALVVLSDGMGHGRQAAFMSRQTVELIRLCMDASYSRQQTVTAVNGMLLMGGSGERFATADILVVDLWNGHATLDKLGSSPSYLVKDDQMIRLVCDALPLGILERVEARTDALNLSAGDAIVMLTDGVEDAFTNQALLEATIWDALEETDETEAASVILQRAMAEADASRMDDQSVVIVRMHRT